MLMDPAGSETSAMAPNTSGRTRLIYRQRPSQAEMAPRSRRSGPGQPATTGRNYGITLVLADRLVRPG